MSNYYLRQNTHLGKDSIQKLKESTVIVVGLGGLGSGVAQILARMGVGSLILIDGDSVQEHNLSRQQLYTIKDIDKPKVLAAKKHLSQINPEINIKTFQKMASENFFEKIEKITCVVDCTDRHESRRIIDSACLKRNIPWVHGAAIREEGLVCVFGGKYSLKSYEDIYKNKTIDEFCEGVVAPITNLISSLQASLVIKIILQKPIPEGILRINLDDWSFDNLNISSRV